ncbi:hypothetical protein D918_02108 [Trichuris suis]|nr:hypothetical protein D918_02108 [Trichuris suis]
MAYSGTRLYNSELTLYREYCSDAKRRKLKLKDEREPESMLKRDPQLRTTLSEARSTNLAHAARRVQINISHRKCVVSTLYSLLRGLFHLLLALLFLLPSAGVFKI